MRWCVVHRRSKVPQKDTRFWRYGSTGGAGVWHKMVANQRNVRHYTWKTRSGSYSWLQTGLLTLINEISIKTLLLKRNTNSSRSDVSSYLLFVTIRIASSDLMISTIYSSCASNDQTGDSKSISPSLYMKAFESYRESHSQKGSLPLHWRSYVEWIAYKQHVV
mgnify:CR=1 FL=1